MDVRGKVSCPHCGTVRNWRKLKLTKTHLEALRRVYRWCGEHVRHEFSRKDIKHLLDTDTMIATFGDLVHFGGILYRPEGKQRGHWGMNMRRASAFLRNIDPVRAVVWMHPFDHSQNTHEEPRLASQISGTDYTRDGEVIIDYGAPSSRPVFGDPAWIAQKQKVASDIA